MGPRYPGPGAKCTFPSAGCKTRCPRKHLRRRLLLPLLVVVRLNPALLLAMLARQSRLPVQWLLVKTMPQNRNQRQRWLEETEEQQRQAVEMGLTAANARCLSRRPRHHLQCPPRVRCLHTCPRRHATEAAAAARSAARLPPCHPILLLFSPLSPRARASIRTTVPRRRVRRVKWCTMAIRTFCWMW